MPDIDPADLGANPNPNPKADAAAAQNFGVEVEIAGKKYMVTAEMASAINAEKANRSGEIERHLQNLGRKIEDVASTALRRDGKPDDKKSDDKPKIDFWDNPEAFFQNLETRILGQVEEKVNGVKSELTSAYTNDRSTEQFWNGFYTDHKDLKEDKFIVDAVMRRDWDELKDMKSAEAKKILADRAREVLLKHGKTEKQDRDVQVEGAGALKTKADKQDVPKVTSLTDVIKARREARRKSRKAG